TLLCGSQAVIFESACHRSILLGGKTKKPGTPIGAGLWIRENGREVKRGSGEPDIHHPRGQSPEGKPAAATA
ncbi:hypothetical protein, partial [Caballeronia sp. GaOx3]|uniref:hypothetical protein n=1 Tax=Caballeronia sp. GaOx3 TaxID=2921740 RepID=UPI0020295744